jgi:hypothetical protein
MTSYVVFILPMLCVSYVLKSVYWLVTISDQFVCLFFLLCLPDVFVCFLWQVSCLTVVSTTFYGPTEMIWYVCCNSLRNLISCYSVFLIGPLALGDETTTWSLNGTQRTPTDITQYPRRNSHLQLPFQVLIACLYIASICFMAKYSF